MESVTATQPEQIPAVANTQQQGNGLKAVVTEAAAAWERTALQRRIQILRLAGFSSSQVDVLAPLYFDQMCETDLARLLRVIVNLAAWVRENFKSDFGGAA